MDAVNQIQFWAKEVKATTDKAGHLLKKGRTQESRTLLLQGKTALARLRTEMENHELFYHPVTGPELAGYLESAETELHGMLSDIDEPFTP